MSVIDCSIRDLVDKQVIIRKCHDSDKIVAMDTTSREVFTITESEMPERFQDYLDNRSEYLDYLDNRSEYLDHLDNRSEYLDYLDNKSEFQLYKKNLTAQIDLYSGLRSVFNFSKQGYKDIQTEIDTYITDVREKGDTAPTKHLLDMFVPSVNTVHNMLPELGIIQTSRNNLRDTVIKLYKECGSPSIQINNTEISNGYHTWGGSRLIVMPLRITDTGKHECIF